MFRVLSCLTTEHDYRLVLLAALICAIASLTAFQIYDRARDARGVQRFGWVFLAGVATGAGIWATHFVAMLAYQPGLPVSYDPVLTGVSLIIAVTVTTFGFTVGSFASGPLQQLTGGGIIGAGISAMHYTGMKAFQIPGRIEWDATLVHSSLAIGVALGATALYAFSRIGARHRVPASAGLLTLAICGMHFTAMGAAIIVPDPTVFVVPAVVDNSIMALAVAGITLIVIFAGVTAVLIDSRTTQDAVTRAQELVDAAFEGIVIAKDGNIHNVNRRITELSGRDRETLVGTPVWNGLFEGEPPASDAGRSRFETMLKGSGGEEIPVEVEYRPYASDRKVNEVYAIRDLRERLKAERRIRFLAHNDTLTGLPNRTSLNVELSRVLRSAEPTREPFAIMCMDLDRFKDVNDVMGHAAGDDVLAEAGRRMIEAVGDKGFLARVGGDEFIVMQSGHHQPEGIAMLASALQDAFQERFKVDGQYVQLGLSGGISVYPENGPGIEDMLSKADIALYRAKSNGRGKCCFFEQEMDEAQRRRRKLAQALHTALSENQFEIRYQPQVELPSSRLIGFEALLRWQHPEHGTVSPDQFIPIAEETGLIVQIGEWVLRTACAEAATWEQPCKVAVNLSPKQLQQNDFAGIVSAILAATGLAPDRLELEITETALIEDYQRALQLLHELKALGVSIAMDDFGTGYSSLSTLQSFPFDRIKIDRTFVEQIETRQEASTIVKSVLSLGKSLDIPVLAEGVENDSQLSFLTAQQCQAVQGFYFGRPETPEQIRGLLESGSILRHSLDRMKKAGGAVKEKKPAPAALAGSG